MDKLTTTCDWIYQQNMNSLHLFLSLSFSAFFATFRHSNLFKAATAAHLILALLFSISGADLGCQQEHDGENEAKAEEVGGLLSTEFSDPIIALG